MSSIILGGEWNPGTQQWVWSGSGDNANLDTMSCSTNPPEGHVNNRLAITILDASGCISTANHASNFWYLCEDYSSGDTTPNTEQKTITTTTTEPTTITTTETTTTTTEHTTTTTEPTTTTTTEPTITTTEPTTTELTTTVAQCPKTCTNGFTNSLWECGCYLLITNRWRSWDVAKADCESRGPGVTLAGIFVFWLVIYPFSE